MSDTPPDSPDTNALAGPRRFWNIMALLPAVAAVVCFWLAVSDSRSGEFILYRFAIVAIFWIGFCALRLAGLKKKKSTGELIGQAFAYFLLYLLLDTLLGVALLYGSCMVGLKFS